MAAKLGTGDVSFRLGSATPAAVYLGSAQVWSAVTVPGAPTSLTGDNNASLYWTAPASDGGSPITSYKVFADGQDVSGSGTFATPSTAGGDVEWNSGVFGNFVWTVVAVNAIGDSATSAPITYEMV